MIRNWSLDQIKQEIWKIKFAVTDHRMDGFVTWGYKQDLIRLKYYIDDQLAACPTYTPEKEFIDKLEAEHTFKILQESK